MTDDGQDDRMDEMIREAASHYNAPPAVPREEMWARIQAARGATRVKRTPGRPARHWIWSAVGAAAVLLLGVGIGYRLRGAPSRGGRLEPVGTQTVAARPTPRADTDTALPAPSSTAAKESPATEPVEPRRYAQQPRTADAPAASPAPDLAYRLAVVEHLARTEALLTSFRAEARTGTIDAQVGPWARDLLRTTRLMESAAETQDPTMRRLLGDLDLVLVQIAQYSAASQGPQRSEELDLIEQSIDRRGVLGKLRAATSPGMIPAGT